MEGSVWLFLAFLLAGIVSLAGVVYPFKPFKKRRVALLSFLGCFVAIVLVAIFSPSPKVSPSNVAGAENDTRFWVTSNRLNRRTCPSESCGIVGQLFFREGVQVLERRDGWARITEPYDAACVENRSEYVDSGDASCTRSNGISNGQFSEWVAVDFLSETRPADPAENATGVEELVAGSDDFARYRTEFVEAAQSLVDEGQCTEQDFREMGGWVKSSNHRDQPIYFTYCGGVSTANRLYLNAESGEIFR